MKIKKPQPILFDLRALCEREVYIKGLNPHLSSYAGTDFSRKGEDESTAHTSVQT